MAVLHFLRFCFCPTQTSREQLLGADPDSLKKRRPLPRRNVVRWISVVSHEAMEGGVNP